jgi:hypothetical protein
MDRVVLILLCLLISSCAVSSQYAYQDDGSVKRCSTVIQTYLGESIVALQFFSPC